MTRLKLRNLEEKDIPAVEQICIETAPAAARSSEKDRQYTLYMYNRYYTRAQKGFCFVAVDDADRAVGYILCAPDYQEYLADFKVHELRSIRQLGVIYALRAAAEMRVQKRFSKKYPAHLHIDLLPPYQRKHLGSALMDTLKAHLAQQNIAGIYLCVGAKNTGAIAFYQRQGFQTLARPGGSFAMGYALQKETK